VVCIIQGIKEEERWGVWMSLSGCGGYGSISWVGNGKDWIGKWGWYDACDW